MKDNFIYSTVLYSTVLYSTVLYKYVLYTDILRDGVGDPELFGRIRMQIRTIRT